MVLSVLAGGGLSGRSGAAFTWTNMVEERIDYALPSYLESELSKLMRGGKDNGESRVLYARTWFDIKEFETWEASRGYGSIGYFGW